jgi:hypothetical protein
MSEKQETRGRKPLDFADRLKNEPLRLLPREIEQIGELAKREGVTKMAWKQRAIRSCLMGKEST